MERERGVVGAGPFPGMETREMGDDSGEKIIPRPPAWPVVLCVSGKEEQKAVQALVEKLKASGREVLVAHRPLCEHMSGRKVSSRERLPGKLHARKVHWVGLGKCAQETFWTLSDSKEVASLVLLDPVLPDQEPSHPGRPGIPKLLVQEVEGRRGKKQGHTLPPRFLANLVGPVEVKVVRSKKKGEDRLPEVILEFLSRVEAGRESE